jgi:hypothetical protein
MRPMIVRHWEVTEWRASFFWAVREPIGARLHLTLYASTYVLAFDNTNGLATGVALANPGRYASNVTGRFCFSPTQKTSAAVEIAPRSEYFTAVLAILWKPVDFHLRAEELHPGSSSAKSGEKCTASRKENTGDRVFMTATMRCH